MFDFKSIMNNIKNLEWKKYFYKNLVICFIVIFFVFFIITITLTKSYTGVVNNELNRYCMEITFNIKNRVGRTLETISDSYNEFMSSEYLYDINIVAYSKEITNENAINSIGSIKNLLNVYSRDTGYVDSIYVYFSKSDYIISNNAYFASGFRDKAQDGKWIDDYKRTDKSVIVRDVKIKGAKKSYLTIIKPLNVDENNLVAYNIDVDDFFGTVNGDVREFYIVDKDGVVVYADNEDYINTNIANHKSGKKIEEAIRSNIGVKGKDDIIFNSIVVDNGSFNIVAGIDSTYYNKQLDKIKITMLFIMILVAIVTVILAFLIVSEFYNMIFDLVLVIDGKKNKSKGKLRELKFVKNKIMTMLDKNAKIENELANRVEIVSNTKKKRLQSQLNSHFLYNTLGVISAIDIREHKRDTDTVRAITNLSDILRFALNDDSYTAAVSEELIYLRKYIEIQKMKYNDKFEYCEEIEENLLDLNIIKMIIQPLVENAIFHGIARSSGHCRLEVKMRRENNMLKIYVSDDGVGISEEKQKYLRNEFAKGVVSDTKTHGLLSVNQRCMLFYGNEYGCEIERKDGITTVIVKHPILENHKEDKK